MPRISIKGQRRNRVTGNITPLKGHNIPGREHEPLQEGGHHLRDVVADGIKRRRNNGETNAQVKEDLAKLRENPVDGDIYRAVMKDPHRLAKLKIARTVNERRILRELGLSKIDREKLTSDGQRAYTQLQKMHSGLTKNYDRQVERFLVRRIKEGQIK